MSGPYPYRTFEEFADVFETARKQVRALKWLFGLILIAIIAGFAALFYFAQDFPKQAFELTSRVRSLERQVDQVQPNIKQVDTVLQTTLTTLAEKIEKVEQDVAALNVRLGGGDTAGAQGDQNPNTNEQKNNDSATTLQESATAPQMPSPLPLPRPRKMTQAPAVARPVASAPASAGPVELKVGNQLAPGQVALEPIPDELENKMPRLKGKMFFRNGDRIFVVDPKDNRIVELLQ
jgi:hypothetical protein